MNILNSKRFSQNSARPGLRLSIQCGLQKLNSCKPCSVAVFGRKSFCKPCSTAISLLQTVLRGQTPRPAAPPPHAKRAATRR